MQGKHNFIFSLDGEQKSFFISNLDVAGFCRLLRSAFQVDKTINALQDAQGNICDLHYFCNNLHAHKDKFYIILAEQRQNKHERQRSRNNNSRNTRISTVEEPSYFVEFGAFLQELQQIRFSQQHPVLTIVLVFDNEYQAGMLGQSIIMRIYKTFAFLQAYYTIVQEEESDSLLLTVFENQTLKHEIEMHITHQIAEEVCTQIEQLLCEEEETEPLLQGSFATPNSNNIPLIVTRGNEKTIMQVEANDNFHSSQGKRTHGVMRVKKAVEKFRSHFESREYEYLLGLIIGQDQSVFAAYQLYQKSQDDSSFIKNLKLLLPSEDNHNLSLQVCTNLCCSQNNMKFATSPSRSDGHYHYDVNPTPALRSSVTVIDQLLNSGELDQVECGMLRELRMDSELDDLIKSLMDYPQEVLNYKQQILIKIVKQFLQGQFQKEISKNFTPLQCEYFLQERSNKGSPISQGFLNFGQFGHLQDLFALLRENAGQLEQQFRIENSYSYYLQNKKRKDSCENFHLHITGPDTQIQLERRASIDSQVMENKKEINFIDKYHVKVLQKYSDEDYEKMFMAVYDQCGKFCDEHEKAKLFRFFNCKNQRLQEILDKYGQRFDITSIMSDINDLLTLQNNNSDNISSPTQGTYIEPKLHKYKNFKFLINYLYEIDKIITLRQAKTFYYLYSIEEMSVMAAYEVYCETKEQDEFLDTLNLIFKVYSSSSRFDFNEIEQFDSLIEQQLNILFAYRRFFNQKQRDALEQNLRSGDNTLLKLFRDFLRNKDQRIFIQRTSEFADQQIVKQKDIEQVDPYQKKIEMNNQQKELIKDVCTKFMKNKIKQIDLLMDAIDKDNTMVRSSIEVYDYTLDKQDLVENIQLIYNYIMKSNVRSILKANLIQLGRSKTDLTYLLRRINQDEPILKGAFELYFQTKDEAELKDTISRILKFSNI